MAALLMEQFELPTLKIRLDTAATTPAVIFQLEVTTDGVRTVEETWTCTTQDMGLPARLGYDRASRRDHIFHMPDYVVEGARQWIEARDPDGPLWLHLVKPIGYLALVPWEEMLQPKLGVPILRVPDFLSDPPAESPHTLEVALCSSMPAAKENFELIQHVGSITEHILKVVARRTRVHIFTDVMFADGVRWEVEQRGLALGEQVLVHDPNAAAAFAVPEKSLRIAETPGSVDNPWLLWMLDALKERSVDVVHFISHGYLSLDKGALALAESPLENTDARIARFVSAGQLTLFLTHLGAWSVFFSSPEHNFSEMGLRLLADTVAQNRPGPLVYHEMRLDQSCSAVAGAYRFLFGDGSAGPPATPALFTYCHPSRLPGASLSPAASDPLARSYSVYELAPELRTSEEKSNIPWVSATERYIEQRVRDLEKMKGAGESYVNQSEIAEVERILEEARLIVARAASDTAGDKTSGVAG